MLLAILIACASALTLDFLNVDTNDDSDNVRLEFTAITTPSIVAWSTFDSYTITGCEGITFTNDGDTMYYSFSYDDVVTTCAFDLVDGKYEKEFTVSITFDSEVDPHVDNFLIKFEADSEVSTVSSGKIFRDHAEEVHTLSHGLTLTRIVSDTVHTAYAAADVERYITGSTLYFKVESESLDHFDVVTMELRETDLSSGLAMTVTETDETGYKVLSFTVPSQQNLGAIRYLYTKYTIAGERRVIDYAFSISAITVSVPAAAFWVAIVACAIIAMIVIGSVVLCCVLRPMKLGKRGIMKSDEIEVDEE